ncbi:MAG: TIGR03086 family protein [Acidimicrobiales bacterium]|nr:TIGR03086 family protein [Acidimicrobiales bacterium]
MTSSTTSTTDNGIDPRPILDRAISTAGSVIAGVQPSQLSAPTPCEDMDVRTMIRHLIGVLDRVSALGRGDDPFAIAETDAADDGWSDAWTTAVGGVTSAWSDDAVLERPMALPWVQGTGADVLATYFSELTVHTWDLAVATGQQPQWDDAVVEAALAARGFLPAENRLALYEQISAAMGLPQVAVPFAEAVAISDDAPAIDRLVAWNGRDPGR